MLWFEECVAAAAFYARPGFGIDRALDYLIGEKFINCLNLPSFYLRGEYQLLMFAAAIRAQFTPTELQAFFARTLPFRGCPHRQRAALKRAREILLP